MSDSNTEQREVNIPLLRKAVEWAEAEAAKSPLECRWDQGDWVTRPEHRAEDLAQDMLGHGARWDEVTALAATLAPSCGTCYCIAGYVGQQLDEQYASTAIVDGVRVEDFARAELGLTPDQADRLFEANNTIEDVRRIAEDLAGERL